MQTTKAIFLALVLIGLGFLLNAIRLVARIAVDELKSTGKTLKTAEELVNQLSDLLDTIPPELEVIAPLEPEDKQAEDLEEPEPEPQQEPPPRPNIPSVSGLTEGDVLSILTHMVTEGEGRLSRRNVEDAGYSRSDYKVLRSRLVQQGYLEKRDYYHQGRSLRWTEEGKNWTQALRAWVSDLNATGQEVDTLDDQWGLTVNTG